MLKSCPLGAASLLAALLGGPMSAQPPTLVVNDYLHEVRVFPPTNPEFAQAASSLGMSATLATLGGGASLVVAVRNDSGQPVETRILFQVSKGRKTVPRDLEVGRYFAVGEEALVAPREIGGALARLLNAGKPGLITGSPTVEPLDAYQGATVTVSVDSATFADGRFIGADTQNLFNSLVAEEKAKKKFFSDVVGFLSAGQSQAQIQQEMTTRRDAANAAKGIGNLAANTESGLSTAALMHLQHLGMASLGEWVAQENAKLVGKPSIHR